MPEINFYWVKIVSLGVAIGSVPLMVVVWLCR
jgi:hypothetical protein